MNDELKNKFGNLFSNLPDQLDDKIFETIIDSEGCKIERIISKGHHSPDNYWYDQGKNEWVMLLKGSAGLRLENDKEIIKMMPGG